MTSTRTLEVRLVRSFGLLLAAVVLGASASLPPPGTVDPQVQLVIGVFLATVVLWITKPVPYAVSSVLSVVLLFALGLTDTFPAAASGFASTLVFFFVVLLLIGQSVAKVGLDDWVANRLVSTTSTPRSSVRRLSATILLLAFVMPSGIARTVTFMPVIDQINERYRLGDDSQFRRLGYYVIGHVNPLASLAIMTGGGMAITTAEVVNSTVGTITWIEWAVYMTPPTILLYAAPVATASAVYRVNTDAGADRDGSPAEDGGDRSVESAVEPLTFDQQVVVAVLLLTILAWGVGSFVGVPALVPAMLAVLVFSLPWFRIITVEEVRDLSWGIIFLVGAMLSLLDVMRDLSAFDLVVDVLFAGVPGLQSGLATLFVLFGFAVLIRGTFSSVSASLLLLLPILLEFAPILGLNPLYVSLSLPFVLGAAVFLPFNQPTVLIAYERGPLELSEIHALGLMTTVYGFLVAALCWLLYWPFLDGLIAGLP